MPDIFKENVISWKMTGTHSEKLFLTPYPKAARTVILLKTTRYLSSERRLGGEISPCKEQRNASLPAAEAGILRVHKESTL